MEATTTIIALIFVVFGVLQIILFFKMWGMTNNIAKISRRLIVDSKEDVIKEIIKGNPNISNILFDKMFEDLRNASQEYYPIIIDEYRAYYKKAGVQIPEALARINCYNDWLKLNSCE